MFSLALIIIGFNDDPRLPSSLLSQEGFEVTNAYRSNDNAKRRYVSCTAISSKKVRCKINAYWSGVENPSGKFKDSPIEPPATYSGKRTLGPSGLRIGSDSIFSQGNSSVASQAITRHEYVQVGIFPQPTQDSKGFIASSTRDLTEEKRTLERLVRHTLALTAGMRLEDLRTRIVAGQSVPAAACGRTNALFGGLHEWCQKEGWTIEANSGAGYYTLRKGDSYAVLPLGSTDIKINGIWKAAGDAVVLRDGRVYVTEIALELLRQI